MTRWIRLRAPRPTTHAGTPADFSIGADVIVAARLASIIFLALFITWANVPHRLWVAAVLFAGSLNHVLWWKRYVRGGRTITKVVAQGTLLSDTVFIGVATILTGGADSPAVLIWGPNLAVAGIWLGVRATTPILVTALGFLLAVGIWDPGVALNLTDVQHAVFAMFMLALIVAHGGIVAARQRASLSVIAAAEDRARRDPLTGLANRSVLDEELPTEIDRARRHGHALSLMMIDLDDFKAVNDSRGHLVGDAVLKDVAAHLAREKRRSDTVIRLGGEEFVVLMPETDEREALALAERLRQRVLSSPGGEGTTISVGVASFPRSATGERALIRAADSALYAAKRFGKNQTVLFEPDPAPAPTRHVEDPVVGG